MRKGLAILAVCGMILALAACGDGEGASSGQTTAGASATAATTAVVTDAVGNTVTTVAQGAQNGTTTTTKPTTGGGTIDTDDVDDPDDGTPSRYRTITYHVAEGDDFATWFDTDYWKMPFAREDDGAFTREGYVLLGYTFDKNGKGTLIRPGYKFTLPTGASAQDLYCVWAKETAASSFTTAAQSDGSVYIKAYKGSDKVVYIPREIGGKTVTGIAAGAFSGNKTLTEVHITSSVKVVEANAFASCTALKTVTLYDSLRRISDAAFTGTTVKTVRMCAGQLPRYMKSLETFGKKYERLVQLNGQKRIVVLAGSSVQYGVDTDYMQTLFQNSYGVVNFGTNGNMNVALFLDAIAPLLNKNDVVVFSPEQYGPYAYHVNGNPEMASATFQGLATCYNLFENIDVTNYTKVFDAIGQYCTVAANMTPLSWEDHYAGMDEYGDLKNLTTKMNTPDYCKKANGEFRFNETVIPAEFIPQLNRVIDRAKGSGATVLFSHPSMNRNNVEASSLNDAAFAAYNNWLSKTVHCKLISDVKEYLYKGEYFYNTDYHLNAVGRELYTQQLAKDIIAAGVGVK